MVAECEAAKKANAFMQIGAYKGKIFFCVVVAIATQMGNAAPAHVNEESQVAGFLW